RSQPTARNGSRAGGRPRLCLGGRSIGTYMTVQDFAAPVSWFPAPTGRRLIARGASPWEVGQKDVCQPHRGGRGTPASAAPVGLEPLSSPSQGLAPLAIDRRPVGAKTMLPNHARLFRCKTRCPSRAGDRACGFGSILTSRGNPAPLQGA